MKQFSYEHILKGGRAVGNSSRQVNYIIEELFENRGEWIPVIDHSSLYQNARVDSIVNKYLLDKVTKRLKEEFRGDYEIKPIRGKLRGVQSSYNFENINTLIDNQNYFLIRLK